MKKYLITAILLVGSVCFSNADGQNIPMHIINDGPMSDGPTYAPPRPWYITQDGYELTFPAFEDDYIIKLYDEESTLVYSTYLYGGSATVILPSTLSGEFELRLIPFSATYYYRGYMEL